MSHQAINYCTDNRVVNQPIEQSTNNKPTHRSINPSINMSTELDSNMFTVLAGQLVSAVRRPVTSAHFEDSFPDCDTSLQLKTWCVSIHHELDLRSTSAHPIQTRPWHLKSAQLDLFMLLITVYKLPPPLVLQDVQEAARARPRDSQVSPLNQTQRVKVGDLA